MASLLDDGLGLLDRVVRQLARLVEAGLGLLARLVRQLLDVCLGHRFVTALVDLRPLQAFTVIVSEKVFDSPSTVFLALRSMMCAASPLWMSLIVLDALVD